MSAKKRYISRSSFHDLRYFQVKLATSTHHPRNTHPLIPVVFATRNPWSNVAAWTIWREGHCWRNILRAIKFPQILGSLFEKTQWNCTDEPPICFVVLVTNNRRVYVNILGQAGYMVPSFLEIFHVSGIFTYIYHENKLGFWGVRRSPIL